MKFSSNPKLTLLILIFSMVTACKKETPPVKLKPGDFYQGGKITYLLQPGDIGYEPLYQHGLIHAVIDKPMATQDFASFGCKGSVIQTDTLFGKGAANTELLTANCSEKGTAPDICSHLELNGYSDWYLPSINELVHLNFKPPGIYLSSSSYTADSAWVLSTSENTVTTWYGSSSSYWLSKKIKVSKSQKSAYIAYRSF